MSEYTLRRNGKSAPSIGDALKLFIVSTGAAKNLPVEAFSVRVWSRGASHAAQIQLSVWQAFSYSGFVDVSGGSVKRAGC